MSKTVSETRITYKYLMNKTKHELAYFILTLIKDTEERIPNDLRCPVCNGNGYQMLEEEYCKCDNCSGTGIHNAYKVTS